MENDSEFEQQFTKLLKDAAKGLEDLQSQFEDMDRNLQTVHSLGKQVYESSHLWHEFNKAIDNNRMFVSDNEVHREQ
ncbi:hypothetical protein G6F46_011407 [Rhizopus delemar]|uniref:Uncharacterized protein n=3 Tax=Rhizopus TaxID=4842 RepID=I1BIU5_RHIO9|nr:hypothetical protein RO3G_00829 [Rhizopus delemar RA 99-880]KAG1055091.1 hypothetical protein G6F43_002929 [Rhizopus delemar]KAG1542687.1 hypothetical protein G6F51_007125 [Rhizopus arrhizus]KAG1447940.1 hypothetical protein G6F55_010883 [Rhizopus delemar]KAG1489840.1 hypothetical protein G6F54_011152 [Rhizopus delemar]|eukprot:EIE76125.1 hypothetical protein RO3G_00829 [Rhizopus delemar RA 99-880]